MKWDTTKIVKDLQALVGTKAVVSTEQSPQGDYYCRDIFIDLIPKSDANDGISIIGFNTEDISDVDKPKEDIKQVEIRNYWSDSNGGLEKGASKDIRELYFIAVDYFNPKKISIVDQLKDFF